jgi:cell division protein FtsZ
LISGEPDQEHSIIKVIGVGGGGGNAVNHMYREGIHDVTFVLCNTDAQALNDSPVPVHLQLGKEGLGAGNKPERARAAAEESIEDVRHMLNDGTKMAFITAGMGGGYRYRCSSCNSPRVQENEHSYGRYRYHTVPF